LDREHDAIQDSLVARLPYFTVDSVPDRHFYVYKRAMPITNKIKSLVNKSPLLKRG
jgi:hypothetical protein